MDARKALAGAAGVLALPLLVIIFLMISLAGDNFGVSPTPAGALWCGGISTGEVDLSGEQVSVAETILAVVEREGFPSEVAIIALSAGLVESELQNLDYGDRDSLGVFQQRPSQGWGIEDQIRDVELATLAFLGLADHTDKKGLTDINWESMPPGVAAQVVQASGHPHRYSGRMAEAQAIYAELTGRESPCGSAAGIVAVPLAGGGSIRVDGALAQNVAALLAAADADGISLGGYGWRSVERTAELRVTNGCPDVYESPANTCRVPTARPGESMHERGLAIDFTYNGSTIKSRGSAAYKWLEANAGDYGLYPLASEPWHWSSTGR